MRPPSRRRCQGRATRFTYQDDTLTAGVTTRTGDGSVAANELRSYDGAGHLTQLRESVPSGWEVTEYRYNNRGLLSGQAVAHLDQDPAVWSHLTYDACGPSPAGRRPPGQR